MRECTSTIIGEVESLKGLVDEFSQFARMPAPRAVPTDLHELLQETLALYDGLFGAVVIERRFDPAVSQVRVDPEQMKRVIINLVDNAIEAMGRDGTLVIETARDTANSLVRVVVADTGPGNPGGRARQAVPAGTIPPRAGAAASGSPSCAASWPSTAAASTWPITCRKALVSRSSYQPDAVHSCRR